MGLRSFLSQPALAQVGFIQLLFNVIACRSYKDAGKK